MGAAVDAQALRDDARYAATLAREFNTLTPENALKFDAIQYKHGEYDFTDADAITEFARRHGMTVRGHCFVWGRALPDWLTTSPHSRAALSHILQEHIETTVSHYREKYPGVIRHWDVANETIPDPTNPESPWLELDTSTEKSLAAAFRWTHEADPSLRLFYNDFHIEEESPKADRVFAVLKRLRSQNVPIHGIGMQMHLDETAPPDFESMSRNFDRFAALGLKIHITELDYRLRIGSTGHATPAQLARQAEAYHRVAKLCLSKPACEAIVLWGFTDKYSWIPSLLPGFGEGLIFNLLYKPKPSHAALSAALETG